MYRDNNGLPKCWICNDSGIVVDVKKIHEFEYEYATRCKCKEGQKSSDRIRTVGDVIAELKAKDNFLKFKEKFPEKFD